jgi:hypothetical protein
MRSRLLRFLVLLATVVLIAAACGDDDATDTTDTTTSTTTVPDASTTTEAAPTTTSQAPDPVPIPDADLPGEDFDIAPAAGRAIAVAGVQFDDTLNVRLMPGMNADVVAELEPTSNDAIATGRARLLTESIWWEVTTADGIIGWVGSSFTAQIGPTSDTTAAVIAEFGYTPEEASVQDLGFLVADTVDNDPDIPTEIVIVVEADETGDLAEVTIDVIGLGDDSVRGVRLHVFGTPLESGDAFALKSVEATDLCDPARGPTTPGGVCA